ncbi:outer membrane murein-binding lipoprotein Lpp [Labrenzia sp. EL_195]|nr:outer membrane murein-binding lipoprotein Lpp [Labrenzia sp. EL_195]
MKIAFSIVIILGLLTLGGCVTNTTVDRVAYDHPTASQQQLFTDRADCAAQAKGIRQTEYGSETGVNDDIWDNCIAGKGYSRNDATGRLEVPKDLRVTTY